MKVIFQTCFCVSVCFQTNFSKLFVMIFNGTCDNCFVFVVSTKMYENMKERLNLTVK